MTEDKELTLDPSKILTLNLEPTMTDGESYRTYCILVVN